MPDQLGCHLEMNTLLAISRYSLRLRRILLRKKFPICVWIEKNRKRGAAQRLIFVLDFVELLYMYILINFKIFAENRRKQFFKEH